MGNLVNQSFAGQNFTGSTTPSMWVGNGDWSSVFNVTNATTEIFLHSTANQTSFPIYEGVYFGSLTADFGSPSFKELTNSTHTGAPLTLGAKIATNYQGLMLTASMWEQWVGLMLEIDTLVTPNFVCASRAGQDFNHNFCYLTKPCSSPEFNILWGYSFNIDFSLKKPTMNIGLGSLAFDQSGGCYFAVNGNELTHDIVIGALALQNFNVQFN